MKVLDRRQAYRRVVANGGAPGVDGVDLKSHLQTHWAEIRKDLRQGTYQPAPIRGRDIPKPSGGVRRLGIATTTDRLIQQAILQVFTPLFDPDFSESSVGFRPERRAQDAVKRARNYMEADTASWSTWT